jgi:hypothetical protein
VKVQYMSLLRAIHQNQIHKEKEQIELGECLLSSNLESFVFPSNI